MKDKELRIEDICTVNLIMYDIAPRQTVVLFTRFSSTVDLDQLDIDYEDWFSRQQLYGTITFIDNILLFRRCVNDTERWEVIKQSKTKG